MKFTHRVGRSEAKSHYKYTRLNRRDSAPLRPSLLIRRIKAAVFDFVAHLAPTRPISPGDLADADYSTHPGGKALRFTDRLRDSFRKTWLRLRR